MAVVYDYHKDRVCCSHQADLLGCCDSGDCRGSGVCVCGVCVCLCVCTHNHMHMHVNVCRGMCTVSVCMYVYVQCIHQNVV